MKYRILKPCDIREEIQEYQYPNSEDHSKKETYHSISHASKYAGKTKIHEQKYSHRRHDQPTDRRSLSAAPKCSHIFLQYGRILAFRQLHRHCIQRRERRSYSDDRKRCHHKDQIQDHDIPDPSKESHHRTVNYKEIHSITLLSLLLPKPDHIPGRLIKHACHDTAVHGRTLHGLRNYPLFTGTVHKLKI